MRNNAFNTYVRFWTYLKKYSELFQLVEYLSVIVTMMFTLLQHFEEQVLILKIIYIFLGVTN